MPLHTPSTCWYESEERRTSATSIIGWGWTDVIARATIRAFTEPRTGCHSLVTPGRGGASTNAAMPRISPLALAGAALFAPATASAASPDLVVSQVYGGGGNSGATLTSDGHDRAFGHRGQGRAGHQRNRAERGVRHRRGRPRPAGYGTANAFEGSGAAPGLSNTTAALRADVVVLGDINDQISDHDPQSCGS